VPSSRRDINDSAFFDRCALIVEDDRPFAFMDEKDLFIALVHMHPDPFAAGEWLDNHRESLLSNLG
jgi:hypothetical protein